MTDVEVVDIVVGILAGAQLNLLQALSTAVGKDFVGLSVAARLAHKTGCISASTKRRLIRLDDAAHVAKLATRQRISSLVGSVHAELATKGSEKPAGDVQPAPHPAEVEETNLEADGACHLRPGICPGWSTSWRCPTRTIPGGG